MGGSVCRWVAGKAGIWIGSWADRSMDGWAGGRWLDRWMVRQMGGYAGRSADGWVDRSVGR